MTDSLVQDDFETRMNVLLEKADAVHLAALNLATTYGVYDGINTALQNKAIGARRASHAIGAVQLDLISMMVIRVCALCEESNRTDDASMFVLISALKDEAVTNSLIEKGRRWQEKIGYRLTTHSDAAADIASLRQKWSSLVRDNQTPLKNIRHLRNKNIGHITIGLDKEKREILANLYKLVRDSLDVASSVRLVFRQENVFYLETIASRQKDGGSLIALLPLRSGDSHI